jgi:acyl-CoA synthetase (AMP-forming)/AMP-acid ligase II
VLLTEFLPHAVRQDPDAVAVRCGDHTLSYRTLTDRVARLAAALEQLGLERGDRVAILHRNCHRVLETYFAAVHAGAVLVPLNHRLTPADLAHIVGETGSRVLVVDEAWAGLARDAVAQVASAVRLVGSRVGGDGRSRGFELDIEDLLDAAAPADLAGSTAEADHPVNIYYTSGTTGHHKGVVLTHRNVASHAVATIRELGLSRNDVWAHVAPMFHLADAWAVWALTLVGAQHVMVDRFAPAKALQCFEDHEVTVTNLVPTMLNDIVACTAAGTTDLSAFRLVMSGGAPISPRLVRQVVDTFACEYVQTYGLTETSPYLTFSLLEDRHRTLPITDQLRIRSMTGRPARGVEVRVVDEQGREVAADGSTVGEIVARGDRVFTGYWRRPRTTAEAFDDSGFFHTGDLATVDPDGYLSIVDRKKDVILSGGELVYSTEVEHVLSEHPAVLEVAVVPRPDERLGERVHAVVAPRPGTEPGADELVAYCRARLAHYKCPKDVTFVEALPRTGSGKINKRVLRTSMGRARLDVIGCGRPARDG